jgi:hypothetical protein
LHYRDTPEVQAFRLSVTCTKEKHMSNTINTTESASFTSSDHYVLWPTSKRGKAVPTFVGTYLQSIPAGESGTVYLDGKAVQVVQQTGGSGFKGKNAEDKAAIFAVHGKVCQISIEPLAPKVLTAEQKVELQAQLQAQLAELTK